MLLYNGQILTEEEVILPLHNRSFQYNDGFFETMIMVNGQVRFWADHLDRIQEAAAVLRLELPAEFLQPDFALKLAELAQKNNCSQLARIKLKVWRAGAGLYTPQTDAVDWLVTATAGQAPPATPVQVGICESVRTLPSSFSAYKGFNAPVYVLASREKAQRDLDDVLLLDPQGNLAELTASNLFWIREQTVFTPSLQSGCLNGIMRRNVLRWAQYQGWCVQEGLFSPVALTQADLVFSGNVNGLRLLATLEGQTLRQNSSLLARLQNELFL